MPASWQTETALWGKLSEELGNGSRDEWVLASWHCSEVYSQNPGPIAMVLKTNQTKTGRFLKSGTCSITSVPFNIFGFSFEKSLS